jgi:hypothetical protein
VNALTDLEYEALERDEERAGQIAETLPAALIEALKVDPFCERLRNWTGDTESRREYTSVRDVYRDALSGKRANDIESCLLSMAGLLLRGENGAAALLAAAAATHIGAHYAEDQVNAIGLHFWG